MKSIVSFLLALSFSGYVMAAQFITFTGQDSRSSKACTLDATILEGQGPLDGSFVVSVTTSYSHGQETPPALIIRQWEANQAKGIGQDQRNQVTLVYSTDFGVSAHADWSKVTHFNLAWRHGNHMHNYRCNIQSVNVR